MESQLFEKLTRMKKIIGRMSINDKLTFVSQISNRLTPEMLKTSDGQPFTTENILAVGLAARFADNKDEFKRITGFYEGGYKSEIRRGMYHNRGSIPHNVWAKEMFRLYHRVKHHVGDVSPPEMQDFQPKVRLELLQEDFSQEELVPADAWQMSKY
jgi:hypothetical protein